MFTWENTRAAEYSPVVTGYGYGRKDGRMDGQMDRETWQLKYYFRFAFLKYIFHILNQTGK